MVARRRYGTSLFLALLLLVGAPAGAAELESTPIRVASGSSEATNDNGQRKFLQTEEGTLELIYGQLENEVDQIFVTSSDDEGSTWTDSIRLSRQEIPARLGSLAEDPDGRLHAAWVDYETVGHVWYAVREDGVWSDAAKISPGPFYAGFPVIAAEADRIHLLWYAAVPDDNYDAGSRYEVIHLLNSEGAWGRPTVVSVGGLDALNPTVAQDRAGVVHTAWYERTVGRYQAHYAFFDKEEWKTPAVISPDTSNALGVAMDISPDGTVHLVWEQFAADGPEVHYSSLADDTWSEPRILASSPAIDPVIASDDNGRLFAAWSDRSAIYTSELQDGSWVAPTNLGPGTNPTLASGEQVRIAWTRPDGAGHEVVTASLLSGLPDDGGGLPGLVWISAVLVGGAVVIGMFFLRRRPHDATDGTSSILWNSGK
jgi:hypothetical protein